MSQHLSDIDANGGSDEVVSILGGFYGEMLLVLSTLEGLSRNPDFEYLSPMLMWKNTKYEEIIKGLFED